MLIMMLCAAVQKRFRQCSVAARQLECKCICGALDLRQNAQHRRLEHICAAVRLRSAYRSRCNGGTRPDCTASHCCQSYQRLAATAATPHASKEPTTAAAAAASPASAVQAARCTTTAASSAYRLEVGQEARSNGICAAVSFIASAPRRRRSAHLLADIQCQDPVGAVRASSDVLSRLAYSLGAPCAPLADLVRSIRHLAAPPRLAHLHQRCKCPTHLCVFILLSATCRRVIVPPVRASGPRWAGRRARQPTDAARCSSLIRF